MAPDADIAEADGGDPDGVILAVEIVLVTDLDSDLLFVGDIELEGLVPSGVLATC